MSRPSPSKEDFLRASTKVIEKHEISIEIKRIANEIEGRIGNLFPVILSVMNGSICFVGELLTQLDFPLEYDSFSISRYRDSTVGGETVHRGLPGIEVRGKVVLIVDDILDQGTTLQSAIRWAKASGAQQVFTAVLVEKQSSNTGKTVKADFKCFEMPNDFLFGFGMDVDGLWRNLKDIYSLKNPASINNY